jgi:hypothetical protein
VTVADLASRGNTATGSVKPPLLYDFPTTDLTARSSPPQSPSSRHGVDRAGVRLPRPFRLSRRRQARDGRGVSRPAAGAGWRFDETPPAARLIFPCPSLSQEKNSLLRTPARAGTRATLALPGAKRPWWRRLVGKPLPIGSLIPAC